MSSEEQKPSTSTNDTGSQNGGDSVQRGGAGAENTPADSDTPQKDSSLVCKVKKDNPKLLSYIISYMKQI